MPMSKGKSKKAFSKNVATEMDAGKPQKQSLAIAYAEQKRAKKRKMYHGGEVSVEHMPDEDISKRPVKFTDGMPEQGGRKNWEEDYPMDSGSDEEAPMGDTKDKTNNRGELIHAARGGMIKSKKERALDAFHGKKMAEGGDVKDVDVHVTKDPELDAEGNPIDPDESTADKWTRRAMEAQDMAKKKLGFKGDGMGYAEGGDVRSKRQRAMDAFYGKKMAEGGQITDNYNSPDTDMNQTEDEEVHDQAEYDSEDYNKSRPMKRDMAAVAEDDRDLNQHGDEELGPMDHMAEGGQIEDNYQDPEGMSDEDLVMRIMKQRHYSKGGRVANANSGESASKPDQMAKDQPNEFDDLALRDDLEFSDTGANSGDELGNARETHDRDDIVARIMASRKKKGRMPGSEKPGL